MLRPVYTKNDDYNNDYISIHTNGMIALTKTVMFCVHEVLSSADLNVEAL